jgi:ABC-type oligopeptide transport system substrate-binding subunit
MLHDLGQDKTFTLSLANVLPTAFQDSIERGVFKLAFIGWMPVVPHPAAYLESLLASGGLLAQSGHFASTAASTTIDGLLTQAALAEPTQQAALYRQATQIALAELPSIPLWQQQQSLLAKAEISGILIEPNGVLRYDSLLR